MNLYIAFQQGFDKPNIRTGGYKRLLSQGLSIRQLMEELVFEAQGSLDHQGNPVRVEPG